MKPPKRLEPLIEDGLVDDVIRQLMSGTGVPPWISTGGSPAWLKIRLFAIPVKLRLS